MTVYFSDLAEHRNHLGVIPTYAEATKRFSIDPCEPRSPFNHLKMQGSDLVFPWYARARFRPVEAQMLSQLTARKKLILHLRKYKLSY